MNEAAAALTPLENAPNLAKAIGLDALFLKREDLHPYGSHKGRSIPVMIDHYAALGDRRFAITGSGNAALAAAIHVKKLGTPFTLDIFIGQHINKEKGERLQKLVDDNIRVFLKERPLQALTQAVEEGARSLRQSTDDEALAGYDSLAVEIVEGLKGEKTATKSGDKIGAKVAAVFMGTSSGTTAQALAAYFLKKKMLIQVHIVQTSSVHPMTDELESYDGHEEISDADAIVDILAYRKNALIPLIKKTGGNGWVATNDEIAHAQALVKEHCGLDVSPNGALAIVGAMQAAYRGWEFPKGVVVCIIGGK